MPLINTNCLKRRSVRSLLGVLIALSIISGVADSATADDQQTQSASMAAIPDLIVVRPVAAVGSILSTSVFMVALPFTYHDNNGFSLLNPLVEKPWRFVTDRPLGVWKTRELPTQPAIQDMNRRYSGILGRTSADSPPDEIR